MEAFPGMKLAIIFNDHRLVGKLTNLFTGCYAYHVAWVDEEASLVYDMDLLRRRRTWPRYPDAQVLLYDFPEVTREYLEHKLETDDSTYGWRDYILFALRPLYHLVGKSTRNANGIICSEMVNNDLRACNVDTPWNEQDPPPSPCDLFRWVKNRA